MVAGEAPKAHRDDFPRGILQEVQTAYEANGRNSKALFASRTAVKRR
jgi:hypothetical protein